LSQTKFPHIKFGFNGGLNQGKFTFPDNSEYQQFARKYEAKIGYNIGLNALFSISNNISFESGLNYYLLKSNTNKPEFVYNDDFVVINEKVNYYDGTLFLNSQIEGSNLRIPLRLNINLFKSETHNFFVFIGYFKDFAFKLSNQSSFSTLIKPTPINEEVEKLAQISFQQNYSTFLRNYNKPAAPDKNGYGFHFGFGYKYKKFGLELNFNRPENTFNQGAIYRFNSTSLNLRYFL
jgi:hypothetical protein